MNQRDGCNSSSNFQRQLLQPLPLLPADCLLSPRTAETAEEPGLELEKLCSDIAGEAADSQKGRSRNRKPGHWSKDGSASLAAVLAWLEKRGVQWGAAPSCYRHHSPRK